jgi:hypothetical protein
MAATLCAGFGAPDDSGAAVKIITHFVYPPIPVRNMDWQAVTDNYDCDCDQDGYFSRDPMGHGATEQEAIADLMAQIEERA